jgi:hypothetical protein
MKQDRWPGEPEKCMCTRMAVATLEETLDCPVGWLWVPGTGFVHAPKWWPR